MNTVLLDVSRREFNVRTAWYRIWQLFYTPQKAQKSTMNRTISLFKSHERFRLDCTSCPGERKKDFFSSIMNYYLTVTRIAFKSLQVVCYILLVNRTPLSLGDRQGRLASPVF